MHIKKSIVGRRDQRPQIRDRAPLYSILKCPSIMKGDNATVHEICLRTFLQEVGACNEMLMSLENIPQVCGY